MNGKKEFVAASGFDAMETLLPKQKAPKLCVKELTNGAFSLSFTVQKDVAKELTKVGKKAVKGEKTVVDKKVRDSIKKNAEACTFDKESTQEIPDKYTKSTTNQGEQKEEHTTTKTMRQLRQQLGLHAKTSKSKAAKGTLKQYYTKSELVQLARRNASHADVEDNTTLTDVLLTEIGIIRTIVRLTSVPQASILLGTCKELHAVEEDVFRKFKLPTKINMSGRRNYGEKSIYIGDGVKLYRAMVRTSESRWLEWLDTSDVEEVDLPKSVTDEEMLRLFDGVRFSKLRVLDLAGSSITSAGLAVVGSGCSHLQELYTNDCTNLTDVGVAEVGKGCPNLYHLGLEGCPNITTECKNALRQLLPDLDIEEDYVCDGSCLNGGHYCDECEESRCHYCDEMPDECEC